MAYGLFGRDLSYMVICTGNVIFLAIGNRSSFNRHTVFFRIGGGMSATGATIYFPSCFEGVVEKIYGKGEKGKKEQYAHDREHKKGHCPKWILPLSKKQP